MHDALKGTRLRAVAAERQVSWVEAVDDRAAAPGPVWALAHATTPIEWVHHGSRRGGVRTSGGTVDVPNIPCPT